MQGAQQPTYLSSDIYKATGSSLILQAKDELVSLTKKVFDLPRLVTESKNMDR